MGSLHDVLRQRQKFLLICDSNARSEMYGTFKVTKRLPLRKINLQNLNFSEIATELERFGKKWSMEVAHGMEHISSKKVLIKVWFW